MKQHVFKPSRVKDGKRVKAKTYSGRYRLPGDIKDTQVALGVRDKQVAEQKLTEIVRREERERQGFYAPRQQIETLRLPIRDVVDSWLADLTAKGCKAHHSGTMAYRLDILIRECGWTRVSEILPDSFVRWRSRQVGKSPSTLNHYLDAVRAFLAWLVKLGRLPQNPLVTVEKAETRGREVVNRRAFTHEEFQRFVSVAPFERRLVYVAGYYTGLRRSELDTLCWADLDLTGDRPSLTIRAGNAKNKETVMLPLHADLLSMLRTKQENLCTIDLADRVFMVPKKLRAFHRDLKLAGIPKSDELGRILDFHALRHSCATRLSSSGVPVAVAMKLLRHRDAKLTLKTYTDGFALPMSESIAKSPVWAFHSWTHSRQALPVVPSPFVARFRVPNVV